MTRRRPRLERRPAETTRLAHAQPPVRHDLTRHVRGLERRVADVTRDLDRTIQSRPLWRATATLDRTTPGVGPVRSRPGLADRHELGTLTRTPIAALVGVAPLARESGTLRGRRLVWGGRAPVRAARSMATLVATRHNPIIRACYQRLVATGKPKMVALAACLRTRLTILNAMARTNTPWEDRLVRQHA